MAKFLSLAFYYHYPLDNKKSQEVNAHWVTGNTTFYLKLVNLCLDDATIF